MIKNTLTWIYRHTLRPIVTICYDRMIKPIFNIQDSPHSIALGTAIGLWIALTPTVGIQMTLSVIACTAAKANILVAVAMCWITNPVTFIPWYYVCYRTGLVATGAPSISWEEFRNMIANDYLIVAGGEGPKYQAAEPHNWIASKQVIHYSSDHPDSLAKVKQWCDERKLLITNWAETKGDVHAVFATIKQGECGVVDWKSLRRSQKAKQPPQVHVLAQVNAMRDGWAQFMAVLALGLTEIALPLWVGGLLWATVIAIPAYPITLRAITRFRTSVQKRKERRAQRKAAQLAAGGQAVPPEGGGDPDDLDDDLDEGEHKSL